MSETQKRIPLHYGRAGGLPKGRPLNADDAFEMAIDRAFGSRLRAGERMLGCAIWRSITKRQWLHLHGDTADYSELAAGDLVAAIVGSGNYTNWCLGSGEPGEVDDEVHLALLDEGWDLAPDQGP